MLTPICNPGGADTVGEPSADSLRLNLETVGKTSPARGTGSSRSQGGENSVRSWLNGEGRTVRRLVSWKCMLDQATLIHVYMCMHNCIAKCIGASVTYGSDWRLALTIYQHVLGFDWSAAADSFTIICSGGHMFCALSGTRKDRFVVSYLLSIAPAIP